MTITGLILAGGRGTRMGHVDKGLQVCRGRPMVQHVIERLAPQVTQVAINANQNLATYQTLCNKVWPDLLSDFRGPLAGLQAGLVHCKTPLLVTVPCDSPFLPLDLVARLAAALEPGNCEVAVAVTGSVEYPQVQPVFCLMKTNLLPQLNAYLDSGARRVDGWYAALRVARVMFEDAAAFSNLNTLEELQRFELD